MNQKINLKEKNLDQLKALAYDLSEVVNEYSGMLNTVNQEIQIRKVQAAEQGAKKLEELSQKKALP